MTFEGLLFDSRGEIGRRDFWFAHLFLFPMEVGAAYLFRVPQNELCSQDPSTFLGKAYYAALAVMALIFLFMWYCVGDQTLTEVGTWAQEFLSPMPSPFY